MPIFVFITLIHFVFVNYLLLQNIPINLYLLFEFELITSKQSQIIKQVQEQMSVFLGLIVQSCIESAQQYYLSALKQIKHYLTLQSKLIINDNNSFLSILQSRSLNDQINSSNKFSLIKNQSYLHRQYQKVYIQNQDDLQFLDVCYQCLMIMKEYFPQHVDIQIEIIQQTFYNQKGNFTHDNFNIKQFVNNLQTQKQEEFVRRVNSTLKSIINQNNITQYQVSNILFFTQNYYSYKNKLAALKYLASSQKNYIQQFAQVDQNTIQYLKNLMKDDQLKKYCSDILDKIYLSKKIKQQKFKPINQQHSKNKKISQQSQYEQKQFRQTNKLRQPLQNINVFQKERNIQNTNNQLKNTNNQISNTNNQLKNTNNQLKNTYNQIKNTNYSVKSIIFQLKQSTSLKRLSMLIEIAGQIKVDDQRYELKINKRIKQICLKFLKNSYNPNWNSQVNQFSRQQLQQVQSFYNSLVKYFKNKVQPNNKQENNNNQSQILLQQIAIKIQQQYFPSI